MKFYLINLDRSADRLAHMSAEFSRLGLDYVRIPAVDGRELPLETLETCVATDRRWTPPLTPAEIGCFLSHKRCLEAIANGDERFAAVLEDDIVFAPDAADLLRGDGWIPGDADLVKIETHRKKVLIEKQVACADTPYSVARLRSAHILSAGYIVSREAARRIVARMDRITAPIDHYLFNPAYGIFDELAIYQCSPAPCIQAGLTSTLGKERRQAYRRPPLGWRILREMRRLLSRSMTGIWGLWTNLTSDRRWKRIPGPRRGVRP